MGAITFTFKTQRAKRTFAAVDINVCYADKTDTHPSKVKVRFDEYLRHEMFEAVFSVRVRRHQNRVIANKRGTRPYCHCGLLTLFVERCVAGQAVTKPEIEC